MDSLGLGKGSTTPVNSSETMVFSAVKEPSLEGCLVGGETRRKSTVMIRSRKTFAICHLTLAGREISPTTVFGRLDVAADES